MNNKWQVIGRGKAGWHANKARSSSSRGSLETYATEAEEGALVYDAFDADESDFIDFVMNGPTLSLELGPDEVDRFNKNDRERASLMLPGLSGGFDTLVAKAISDESWSGLDRVGVNVYESLLRKVGGVRFGRVSNGQVEWGE